MKPVVDAPRRVSLCETRVETHSFPDLASLARSFARTHTRVRPN